MRAYAQLRHWIFCIGMLILFSIMVTPAFASGLSAQVEKQSGCRWIVTLTSTGLDPGANVYATLDSSSAQDCSGRFTNPKWSNWHVGVADAHGRHTVDIRHGDFGRYTFTVRDSSGNTASTTLEYGNGPDPQATSSGSSAGNTAGCNSKMRLSIGDEPTVSNATSDPLPLRSNHSTRSDILAQIPVLTQVEVLDGPFCEGKLVWWKIQYGETVGWSAEINGYDNYNLILDTTSVRLINIDYRHEAWDGYIIPIEFDSDQCLITNGAEVVARVIRSFSLRFFEVVETASKWPFVVGFFAPDSGVQAGEIETLRQSIIAELIQHGTTCQDFSYEVGDQSMDSSGLGNIIFGYYAAIDGFDYESDEFLSDSQQGVNQRALLSFNDDAADAIQRLVGKRLGKESPRVAPNKQEVATVAEDIDLR